MGISIPVIGAPGLLDGGAGLGVEGVDYISLTVTTTSSPETVTLTRITPTGTTSTVTWGDGNSSVIADGEVGSTAHEYATAGAYTLTLTSFDAMTFINIGAEPISGDISGWTLPASLSNLRLNTTSVSGDISGWTLPAALLRLYLYDTSVSGDISGWTLPAALQYLYLYDTSVSGDISGWTLPAALQYLRIYNTSVSGAPDISSSAAMSDYRIQDCGLSETDVDDILLGIYNRRAAFTYATPTLYIGGTNAAPSGTYQDGDPPTTGLEYVYELANDPETEGFNTWAITYTGGSAP